MSVISNNTLAGSSGQGGAGYAIDRSLRFNPVDSGHLSKTYASAGNKKTFTLSYWIKECGKGTSPSNNPHILWSGTGSATRGGFAHRGTGSDAGKLYLFNQESNSTNCSVYTNSLHRDFSAWKHIVLAVDTTQATSTNRVKIYINGVEETLNFSTTPAQNLDLQINASQLHQIGRGTSDDYANAYLADIHFIDGQALAATDFGEYDSNSVWQPIEYAGTYGTNGFKLDFNSNGQVYSDEITGSDYNSTYSKEKMFDSSLTTGYLAGDSSSVTWTPTGGLAFNSTLKIKAYATSSNITFNWSGGSYTLPVSTNQYYDVSSNVTSPITSVTWTTGASAAGPYVYAVEVDGKVLVNHNSIEADSSGNGNHWTANNLTASSGIGPGITSTVPENLTGNWTGIIGIVPSGTSGAVAVFPDGGGTAQSRGTFYWTGLTIGDTITWYGTANNQTRSVVGNVDETSVSVPGGSLGSFQLTVSAASGSAKIDFNGTANCYGITPGPVSTEYNDFLRDSPSQIADQTDTGVGGEVVGNYCTWNPLDKATVTLANGNLDITAASTDHCVRGTIAVPESVKIYYEFNVTQRGGGGAQSPIVGVALPSLTLTQNPDSQPSNHWSYSGSGQKLGGGSSYTSYGSSLSAGDVLGVAIDRSAGRIWFSLNGTWQNSGDPTSSTDTNAAFTNVPTTGTLFIFFGNNNGTPGLGILNAGQRAFAYSSPTDYKALCTTNLPDPTIADGSTAFDAKLYSGTGSSQSITGLGFSPDLVWTKNRGASASHALYDSVRGAGELLRSNETTAEVNVSSRFTSFDSNGFSIGGTSSENNGSSNSYVSWAWDAGSSNTTIAAGGLNSSVYNQTRTWSGDWTGGFYNAYHNATKIFDGNLLTYASVTFPVPAGVTLTVSPAITGSTIRVYYSRSTSSTPCLVNGTETLPSTGAAQTFQWYTLTATSISSFKLTHDHNGESYLAAIEVDGKMLVDSGVTPATSVPSIASTVRANPSAGFSIVSYTATSSTGTIGHGLNAAPAFVVCKRRDSTGSWWAGHVGAGWTKGGYLQVGDAFSALSGFWNNTAPDSNVVTLGSYPTEGSTSATYVAYCFAPVEGYSSFGTWEGNSDANGPFVFTGHRPAFILLKGIDHNHYWAMHDDARDPVNTGDKQYLWANDSGQEYNGFDVDFLANGFKLRNSNGNWNTSGTYIYASFASHPFKNSRAS